MLLMQQSAQLSTKSFGNAGLCDIQRKSLSSVNWVSVINFLENEYKQSSIRQKQWFLQKKLLNQEVLKLKNQLTATQNINVNLNHRIKLLENFVKKQKLMKNSNKQKQQKQEIKIEEKKTIQAIQKYFLKNGWNLTQKYQTKEENTHKKFLNKVLQEVGINFNKIEEKCRKLSLNSLDLDKTTTKSKPQSFSNLISQINSIKITSKTKINAHLDAIRGLYQFSNNKNNQNLIATVSQDCLLKLWTIDEKQKQNKQNIQPLMCLRQHTGQLFALDGGQTNQVKEDFILFTGGSQEFVKVWYAPSIERLSNFACVGSFLNDSNNQNLQMNQDYNEIVWNLKYKQKKLLTSSSDGIVRLFSTQIQNINNRYTPTIEFKKQFAQKNYYQSVVQWVGERGILAACSNHPKINLWDIQFGKIMQKFVYEIDKPQEEKQKNQKREQISSNLYQINSLKYVSGDKTIYAGCQDRAIRIFSYDANKMLKKLDAGYNNSINCLQIYKSNFIVAGCQSGTLKIWDRRTYKLLINQESHAKKYDEGILCLRSYGDGIMTGGADDLMWKIYILRLKKQKKKYIIRNSLTVTTNKKLEQNDKESNHQIKFGEVQVFK